MFSEFNDTLVSLNSEDLKLERHKGSVFPFPHKFHDVNKLHSTLERNAL